MTESVLFRPEDRGYLFLFASKWYFIFIFNLKLHFHVCMFLPKNDIVYITKVYYHLLYFYFL